MLASDGHTYPVRSMRPRQTTFLLRYGGVLLAVRMTTTRSGKGLVPFSRRSFEHARFEQVQNHDDHALPGTRETQECSCAHVWRRAGTFILLAHWCKLIGGSKVGHVFCTFLKRESAHVAYQSAEPRERRKTVRASIRKNVSKSTAKRGRLLLVLDRFVDRLAATSHACSRKIQMSREPTVNIHRIHNVH
jgi:hypothetical protein